jgi:hypothetical protein
MPLTPFRSVPLFAGQGGAYASIMQPYPSQCALPGFVMPNGSDCSVSAAIVLDQLIDPAASASFPVLSLGFLITSDMPQNPMPQFTIVVGICGTTDLLGGNVGWNAQPANLPAVNTDVLTGRNRMRGVVFNPLDCSGLGGITRLLNIKITRLGGKDSFQGDIMLFDAVLQENLP